MAPLFLQRGNSIVNQQSWPRHGGKRISFSGWNDFFTQWLVNIKANDTDPKYLDHGVKDGRSHKSLKRSPWSALPHTPSQPLSRIQPAYSPLKASCSLYVYQSPAEALFKCRTFKSSHDSRPQGAFPFLTSNQQLLPFVQQRHIEHLLQAQHGVGRSGKDKEPMLRSISTTGETCKGDSMGSGPRKTTVDEDSVGGKYVSLQNTSNRVLNMIPWSAQKKPGSW